MQQKIVKQKIIEQKQKQELDEIERCTFHPKIIEMEHASPIYNQQPESVNE